jgi:transcriptional regulator with XRE-family HTH domain
MASMEAPVVTEKSAEDPRSRVKRWMAENKLSQRDLAKLLECDPSYPAHFLRSDRSPGLAIAVKLEELTTSWPEGPIQAKDWVAHSTTVHSPAPAGECPQ